MRSKEPRKRHSLLCVNLIALIGVATTWASTEPRPRLIVSTDIGGTDPDDFQSMVHLLLYADVLEIEGLIASPYGPGRKGDILTVIDRYAVDRPALNSHSADYPEADALRRITKQGAIERAPYAGVTQPTEGSEWLIACARRDDPRPLHVLVWGGLEDLAQALHDAPDILPKLRVYWIGGPNKKWSADAYQYLLSHHREIWFLESNATYRGWFVGGDQGGEWGNDTFVARHLAGHGALGAFFVSQLEGTIKMGDTPSVAWLLHGDSKDPTAPGWGGRFAPAWERPRLRLDRLPGENDEMEIFGVLELSIPFAGPTDRNTNAFLVVENQRLPGDFSQPNHVRFRFCPKAAKTYTFRMESALRSIDGRTGHLLVTLPDQAHASQPDASLPHWWTDLPDPHWAEGPHWGAKTVNRWRREFLSDFARRADRLSP